MNSFVCRLVFSECHNFVQACIKQAKFKSEWGPGVELGQLQKKKVNNSKVSK